MNSATVLDQPVLPEVTPRSTVSARRSAHLAFFLENLEGGGVQKVTLRIALELAARGHRVEVLVCHPHGPLLAELPRHLRLVRLERTHFLSARIFAVRADPRGLPVLLRPMLLARHPSSTLPYLPTLTRYLRVSRPDALFAATPYMNVEAYLARRLAGVSCRLLLSEHNDLSNAHPLSTGTRGRHLPALCRRAYLQADSVVAVSRGLANELARRTGIPCERIRTVYNPVVTRELAAKAREPLDHPWFQAGSPPVILAAGRPGRGKDFPTLIRAFARLRQERPARLVILGEGKTKKGKADKRKLELAALAAQLGIGDDVALPGYVHNPFPFMTHAAVFVVSSAYEGFCNVLVEAMACGCPVVSTNCPSGPAEILDNGRYGPLVPMRDDAALAGAIADLLDSPTDPAMLRARANAFTADRAMDQYEEMLTQEAPYPAQATSPKS
jgi:glycosyltransferase involved in cell wall biosynthesis